MVSVFTSGSLDLSADDDGIAHDRPCPASFENHANAVEIPSHVAQLHPQQSQRLRSDDAESPTVNQRLQSGVAKMTPENISESEAAVTVQKVYRSYRTRRRLADCAVMNKEIEWWNVLEGALLKHRSETFYAYERQDTAASRWSRLEKKAAKVGKGLSKDENARKLAIQHWLEAIDPRHRYGHNLRLYNEAWEKRPTKEPFFYWLDVGEGKDVDLPECKRSKLQKQQIRYLGPVEREQYEVLVTGGKLRYKKSGELVNTPKGNKWIFVMSASGRLYVAQKDKGSFQHSSFLAGAATKAAGRLLVSNGTLELMEAHSGHYRPTEENFDDLLKVLEELGTDLRMAKMQTVSDDMLLVENKNLQKLSSGQMYDLNVTTKDYKPEFLNLRESQINESAVSQQAHSETKSNKDSEAKEEKESPTEGLSNSGAQDPPNALLCSNGFQSQLPDEMILNTDCHVRVEIESKILDKITIPDKPAEITSSVCEELNEEESAKMVLFQPAETDVRKWTSGAGPRIASLADLPRETLLKILEDVGKPFETSV